MKSKIILFCAIVLACASCHDSDDEATERYVGEWLLAKPVDVVESHDLSESFKDYIKTVVHFYKHDTLIVSKDSIYHIDASYGSTTTGNDVLTIKGNMAKLDVSSTTTGRVDQEIRVKKEYYLVFKSGTYDNGYQLSVVKHDGIFVVSTNDRILPLENYKFKLSNLTERDTVSSKEITIRKSFSAHATAAADGTLLFNRNDTTFVATKEDGGYYLEMIKPSENDFCDHTMERK